MPKIPRCSVILKDQTFSVIAISFAYRIWIWIGVLLKNTDGYKTMPAYNTTLVTASVVAPDPDPGGLK